MKDSVNVTPETIRKSGPRLRLNDCTLGLLGERTLEEKRLTTGLFGAISVHDLHAKEMYFVDIYKYILTCWLSNFGA